LVETWKILALLFTLAYCFKSHWRLVSLQTNCTVLLKVWSDCFPLFSGQCLCPGYATDPFNAKHQAELREAVNTNFSMPLSWLCYRSL